MWKLFCIAFAATRDSRISQLHVCHDCRRLPSRCAKLLEGSNFSRSLSLRATPSIQRQRRLLLAQPRRWFSGITASDGSALRVVLAYVHCLFDQRQPRVVFGSNQPRRLVPCTVEQRCRQNQRRLDPSSHPFAIDCAFAWTLSSRPLMPRSSASSSILCSSRWFP